MSEKPTYVASKSYSKAKVFRAKLHPGAIKKESPNLKAIVSLSEYTKGSVRKAFECFC